MGTHVDPPVTDTGYPRRSGKGPDGGGAFVVVGARESRVHGEGGQRAGELVEPEQQFVDSDYHADLAWLLNVQRKLYQWSRRHPDVAYRELWNWVIDPRNLRCAWHRVASNRGRRTSGIDGVTVGSVRRRGVAEFLDGVRKDLHNGKYRPSPSRRRLIPKLSNPGEFRPLGIPTVRDRVVQSAIKQILEPIFEAGFWHVSYGFRPGRGCHGALEHIRTCIRPRATGPDGRRNQAPYQWVIEGDIKSCFDNIDHHQLLERVRGRVRDKKVTRLLCQFLKSGVLSEGQFLRTDSGTPQGGIISPLLANIALSVIEERYERWVNHQTKLRPHRKSDGMRAAQGARTTDRRLGRPVYFPVRYADDFVILVCGSKEDAHAERDALSKYLRECTGLELSAHKTKVTAITDGFEFLGHRVRLRWDPRFGLTPRIEIPKAKMVDLRYRFKKLTGRTRLGLSLYRVLGDLNPILRGWGGFYRFCTNAKRFFGQLDWYVADRLWRWMRKKHPKAGAREIARFKRLAQGRRWLVWAVEDRELFLMSSLPVHRYRRGGMTPPLFTIALGEPGA